MATNFGYAFTAVGLTKIIHIVFGIISLGCIAATFDKDEIRDRYFFGAIVTCFLVSLIYFIVHLASYGVAIHVVNKAIDEVYHAIGAILLLVGACLFLHLTVTFNQKYCGDIPNALYPNSRLCGGRFATKVTGGAFGLLNGIFYIIAVVLRGLERNEDEEEEATEYRK